MARYKFTNEECSIVQDSTDGAFIPVGVGTWRSDDYAEWIAAGNTTDPYSGPDDV